MRQHKRVEVVFTMTVVMDDIGDLRAINCECGICGERGYKGSDALYEHAAKHHNEGEV